MTLDEALAIAATCDEARMVLIVRRSGQHAPGHYGTGAVQVVEASEGIVRVKGGGPLFVPDGVHEFARASSRSWTLVLKAHGDGPDAARPQHERVTASA
jgi:hypothetical protein